MATVLWLGGAEAVAQIDDASVDTFDAATTYTVTIGQIKVSVVGDTDVATTAANLVTALEASGHPYFEAVGWTNPSGGTIRGTANVAGVPFTATLTVSGGTGTVTDFANQTASAGPNDWSTAQNWDGGAVPVASDDVVILDSDVPIAWGLDQALELDELRIDKSYTGKIGLPRSSFATGVDGGTPDTDAPEYRDAYLKIGWVTAYLGQVVGDAEPAGSTMLKLDNRRTSASTTYVYDTASSGEDDLPPLRLQCDSTLADVYVYGGQVGIHVDPFGDFDEVGDVLIATDDPTTSVTIGLCGPQTVRITEGNLKLYTLFNLSTITVDGGEVLLASPNTNTHATVTVNAGKVTVLERGAGSNVIMTTLNLNGGEIDFSQDLSPKTVTTVNHEGGILKFNDQLTITTYNPPTSGASLTAAALTESTG